MTNLARAVSDERLATLGEPSSNLPGMPLSCPECEEEFENSRALGSHRRYKHGVVGLASSSRRRVNSMEGLQEIRAQLRSQLKAIQVAERALDTLEEAMQVLSQPLPELLSSETETVAE